MSDPEESQYWGRALESAERTLDRQQNLIIDSRRALLQMIRYHLVFIGFVITLVSLDGVHLLSLEEGIILTSTLPSFLAISKGISGHRKLANSKLGLRFHEFGSIYEDHDNIRGAYRELLAQNNDMAGTNFELSNDADDYRRKTVHYLFLGFGMLVGTTIGVNLLRLPLLSI